MSFSSANSSLKIGGVNFDRCLRLIFKSSLVFRQCLLQIYLSPTKPDIKCINPHAHARAEWWVLLTNMSCPVIENFSLCDQTD